MLLRMHHYTQQISSSMLFCGLLQCSLAILGRFGATIDPFWCVAKSLSTRLQRCCHSGWGLSNEENSPDAFEQGSSIICVVSYQQAQDFLGGNDLHRLDAFAKGKFNCKSKTYVLTNFKMRPHGIACIERSGFGLQSLVGKAPALGLALAGRWVFDTSGGYQKYQLSSGIEEFVATPFKKLHERLKSFQQPTLSIMSRCIGFNIFILSFMPYTMSFLGLNTHELNRLRQTAVGFILKKHWIAAEILHVVRYLKIAPMLDSGLSALVAALGLYLEGNSVEELTSEVQHANCNVDNSLS